MATKNTQQYTQRHATFQDTAAIAEFLNAVAQSRYGANRVSEDEVKAWFRTQEPLPEEDTQCWFDETGRMMAYAQVYTPDYPPVWDTYQDATLHPEVEDDRVLWGAVLDWSESFSRRCPAKQSAAGWVCGARIHEADAAKRREYTQRNYERVCTESLMSRSLLDVPVDTPVWSEGIHVRQLDLATELEAYALAYGEAFTDHWGSREKTAEELVRDRRCEIDSWGDEFIPELWFAAYEGDKLVGSVGSFVNHGGLMERSYLYHVFVRPAWRKRGIAKALLLHAFGALAARDCTTVELHVESKNPTGALQLYESVGLRAVWQQHLHEKLFSRVRSCFLGFSEASSQYLHPGG